MPRFVIDASPFHTSLFLTNNASVGLPAVFHHIYNFGSTTMFWSMGAPRKKIDLDKDGKAVRTPQHPRYILLLLDENRPQNAQPAD
jgi:hypothetical protein